MNIIKRRKVIGSLAGVVLLYPFVASCKGRSSMNNGMILNVVLFNNLNRPIFEVLLNGSDIGAANAYGGGGGIATGERIPFGRQTLTWRLGGPEGTPHNGETVTVKNSLAISEVEVPPKTRYLGVHIYPDNTAELTFSQYIPERTSRGERIIAEANKHAR